MNFSKPNTLRVVFDQEASLVENVHGWLMSSLLERNLNCCYNIGNLAKMKRIQEIPIPCVSPLEDSSN